LLGRAGVVLALTRAAPAHAAELRWSGPPECDRQEAVSIQVESIVGRPLASVEALSFEVTVTRDGEAWRLELVTDDRGAKGRRSLSGQSCGEVVDAAAVLIAMAIRGAGQASAAPAAETSSAPDEALPERVPRPSATGNADRTRSPSRAQAKRSPGPVFGLSGAIDTAALPGASPGIAAHAGVIGSSFRLELEGAAFLPKRLELEQGRSAEFALLSGALLGCVETPFGEARAGGCGGFELGSLSGEGRGVSEPHLGSALWEAARLELLGGYPLGHGLGLTAAAGLALALSRPDFELDGAAVYKPARLGFRGSLGVELAP